VPHNVESYITGDKTNFYKSADVSQVSSFVCLLLLLLCDIYVFVWYKQINLVTIFIRINTLKTTTKQKQQQQTNKQTNKQHARWCSCIRPMLLHHHLATSLARIARSTVYRRRCATVIIATVVLKPVFKSCCCCCCCFIVLC
jgi:hypothetical protein